MENKEVWVVVLVLGFVLLLNSNAFTGQSIAYPMSDARIANLQRAMAPSAEYTPFRQYPTGYKLPQEPKGYLSRDIITGPIGSGYSQRYGYGAGQIVTSPTGSGYAPALLTGAGEFAGQPVPGVSFPSGTQGYDQSRFRQQGQHDITPRGYTQPVRGRY